ncbi:MAG: hypothetical protein F4Z17_04500 [Acidimicrobiia bacterium]|nr:hypothetical protein [Acidimicrobiia bacterium]
MNATGDPLELPEELSVDQFWGFFGRREHTGLDFKRGVNRGLLVAIPAMAMTSGGYVVHGVDDDRSIVGCPLTQTTQDRILRYAAECDVQVHVRSIRVGGTELTITSVPEIAGRIVTTPDGRLVRRVGGDSLPLRGDALRRFVLARSEYPGEEEIVPHFNADDFALDMINQALRADGREPVGLAGLERALVDLRVAKPAQGTSGPLVLRAAAILFCKDPAEHVSGATVQFVRRAAVGPGPAPTTRRAEIKGPLPRLLEECLAMIGDNTRRFEAVMGVRREVIPEYPTQVLREAVANALAHRDYGLVGATVDITVWDDRVEITSPGPLPGHITPDNIQTEHYSRNRRIMGVLKTMGLVEEYGEGVDLMIRGMESRLMERPVFSANPDSVTVTLRSRALVGVEDQVWLQLFADHSMTVEERLALVTARSEGAVTPRRLRALRAGTDASAVLAGAVAKGLLTRVGVRGGARYVLSDEVVLRAGTTGIQARSRQQQLLLDEIGRRGSLSTVEGAELVGEQLGVVRNLLNDLVQAGLARAEGRTRARRYYPPC